MPPASNPYLDAVAQAATAAGIDPKWAQATLLTENTPGDPQAVSPAGAVGLMQVMPQNAAGANLADPMANIQRGVQILAANLKAAGGDKSKASAMYFAGPNPAQWGPKTYDYVGRVATNYQVAPGMTSGSDASDTPALDGLMAQKNAATPPPATDDGPAQTPALDALNTKASAAIAAQQSAQAQQGGIGANMKAGIEDVLIRPGLALDNALNGTAVGGFLQRHNILATPEQDQATYARDTSNLGTTLPDQAARFAGEAATAAPVLAAGGEVLGAAAGAAGAGLDAAGAGTAANVTRGAGQLVTGNAGQWGAGVQARGEHSAASWVLRRRGLSGPCRSRKRLRRGWRQSRAWQTVPGVPHPCPRQLRAQCSGRSAAAMSTVAASFEVEKMDMPGRHAPVPVQDLLRRRLGNAVGPPAAAAHSGHNRPVSEFLKPH